MSGWVSVATRTPDKTERVLFVDKNSQEIKIGKYHGKGARGVHFFSSYNSIRSGQWWRELPEAPGEGESDG